MIVMVLISFHGNVAEVWRVAASAGHTRMFDFDLSFTTEITIWSLFFGTVVTTLSSYSSDQVIVQRYFTTKSKKEMARAVLFNGLITVPVTLGLYFIGIGFSAYYQRNPALAASLTDPQQVMPHFVSHVLPSGLGGVVIAGLLAATMSSLSSGMNSLSTATFIDFIRRFRTGPERSEAVDVRWAKYCTLGWGVGATVAAMFVSRLGGILQISGKISGFFSGPLVGMFLLGLLTKRANAFGVLPGAILGTAVTWFVADHTSVSWLWYGPAGCAATMVSGFALSLLRPATIQDFDAKGALDSDVTI